MYNTLNPAIVNMLCQQRHRIIQLHSHVTTHRDEAVRQVLERLIVLSVVRHLHRKYIVGHERVDQHVVVAADASGERAELGRHDVARQVAAERVTPVRVVVEDPGNSGTPYKSS